MQRYLLCLVLLLTCACQAFAEPVTIRILHINDLHGFANPVTTPGANTPLGGAARLAKQIKQLRTQHPSLLLAAGDMIQGDTWARLTEGKNVIELMNLLGVDAMTLGNHEFDYGQTVLKRRIEEATFPMLAANLNGLPTTIPRIYFNRMGVRIAVIGLVTEETPQSSHPRNVTGLTFSSPLEVAREQISEAELTADLVILLTHQGYEHDRALAQTLCNESAPATPVPILIVGGHTHTRLQQPIRIGNCTVAQAWEHGKALGVIDLTLDNGKLLHVKGRLAEITPALGPGDRRMAGLVERYNRETKTQLGKQAGLAAVDLIQQGARLRETNLGNLVADIVRQTTKAQVAIINGGSLRTGIPKGAITAGQLYAALPFNNYLVAVRMSGRQLLAALEHGVSGLPNEEGRFPQVSGISFSFAPGKPVGQRVLTASVNGRPIAPDQEYSVATLDFIAAGGDGYTAFGEAIRSAGDFSEVAGAMKSSRLVYNDPGRFLRDVMLEVLTTRKTVTAAVEGRICEVR